MASQHGHADVVQLLIQHGANIHAEDYDGQNALQLATANEHTDVVALLIQHGAIFNA